MSKISFCSRQAQTFLKIKVETARGRPRVAACQDILTKLFLRFKKYFTKVKKFIFKVRNS
ncbi:hypothetical protein JL39_12975 [Rhizobium sp. YS-1r]|nr:hypothetical protein JL39_12975 [Rhizobium sp. YS-1r]